MMLRTTIKLVAVAVAAASLGMSRPAQASITLTLSDGIPADTVTLTDGGTGSINLTNVVVGSFTVNGSVDGPPNPADVNPLTLAQTQNTVNVLSSGSGTLTITMVDQGLSFPSPSAQALALESDITSSTLTGTGSSFSFQSYVDAGNGTNPATATFTTGLQGPYTTKNTGATGDITAPIVPPISSPFSLLNVLTFSASAANAKLSDTGTSTVYATPEPSTLVAAACALPVLGLGAWLRRRKV